jgi:thioredoxin-like negative regulator of GroEL
MKPAWDRLADEIDKSVFIADINCSDEADLCQENDVQGYPTIKVYRDGKPEPYEGGRSFDELFAYADENLAEKCNVLDETKRKEKCDEKSQQYYAKWVPKAADLQQKELTRLEGMLNKSMTADLKKWLRQRVSILKQLASGGSDADEKKTEEL